ncbi:hypothetical protein O7634_29860 [Micromonospora sp. WMMD1120]|uniref:hypothetical protein n=1 Tax=Micromonospora sp. WMMD1120 TaxID=3016106 RepID=UPI00241739AF|nr:hypothetical protein [Micromonospora sp. WMMD1120]MDG4810985.1 hypothetical protein [Micromonospora sp. WMMD1120]
MSAEQVITAALAAGAGAGLKDTASAVVQDAYAGLKDLLKHRFGDREGTAARALAADETDPGVWQARIGEALVTSGADGDERVLAAARRLLDLADPVGKFRVDAHAAKGVQIGDHTTQNNTFS